MYAGNMYAGITYAGTNLFEQLRRLGAGIGGSGFPAVYGLLDAEIEKRKRRRREHVLAMRDDEDSLMNV